MVTRRQFLKATGVLGAGLLVATRPGRVVQAQGPLPPLPKRPQPSKRITSAQRQLAAERAKAAGMQPGLAAGQKAVMDPGGLPHYFGPFANYANSPMPTGGIASITVDSAGSGYTAPVVTITDVYGMGGGAAATAVVVGGAIQNITLDAAGSGYSRPVITITDIAGVGATASATIGGSLVGGIHKFVDRMPGLGYANRNLLGQYIPVAVPDTTTYPGCDYYEIELGQYSEQLHTDLPKTLLRGYRQTNPADNDPNVSVFHYLGPLIVAKRDVPVRIKFTNSLAIGDGGNLFIPVDKTVMGAGMGPLDMAGMTGMKEEYTQNRATLHLHGGLIPWISDGTPHQWTTPAKETTQYPKGVSVQYVPDMWFVNGTVVPNTVGQTTPPVAGATNDPGDGSLTFYYNNQQSARLMFYHDHSYGITRLNVYAGEAAGYLLTDQVEQDLINGTNVSGVNPGLLKVLPDAGIPLILQDKTFVDAAAIPGQDPTWNWGTGTLAPTTGDLWVPSVYMPAQNPWDPSGANTFGRWQYGPWFWPPTNDIANPPVTNEYYQPDPNLPNFAPWEPPKRPASPRPSMGMEAFNDTPLVNGTAYPYLEVEPRAYRFRILNAANDRFFNLHFYVADPTVVTADGRTNTEVKMVPAVQTPGFPATWSTDGRAGGVPDPFTAGPSWIQIGTEGGFLPAPVEIPAQPINWNMNATAFNVGNVTDHSLLLGCAERADVIVDFSPFAGKTLILYNDAPAAFPALDPRYDYYTGDPDQTDTGGAPTTLPGYGPNTRTIMQIKVGGLLSAVPVGSVVLTSGGDDYTSPVVSFVGGGGLDAAATARGVVGHLAVTGAGSGYTTPTVSITGGGGSGATATAVVVAGAIVAVRLTKAGTGYTAAPTVSITDPDPGASGATAKATLMLTALTLTNPGSGYTSAPTVIITDDGFTGSGATALASLTRVSTVDLAALQAAFAKGPAPDKRGVFEASQDTIIVPQAAYNSAYNATFPSTVPEQYVQLFDTQKTFRPIGAASDVTIVFKEKAIHDEMGAAYDLEYGRMGGLMGLELLNTSNLTQNIILYGYASPPVEILQNSIAPIGTLGDGTQIWKITHNGVDTHPIHVHLFNAQLINRVAWDGALLPPEPNELGWKETVRVNPLESTIIALRPVAPVQPFDLPNSVRPIDPAMPLGAPLMGPPGGFIDPALNAVSVTNHLVNYGWEYVWHCHILSHEEMDMMHAMAFAVAPKAPSNLTAIALGGTKGLRLSWTDNAINETGFVVQKAATATGPWTTLTTRPAAAGTGATVQYTDASFRSSQTFYYRVMATNVIGDAFAYGGAAVGFPTQAINSQAIVIGPPAAPSNLTLVGVTVGSGNRRTVNLSWTDNANNETGFTIQRATSANGPWSTATTVGAATATAPTTVTGNDTGAKANTSYYYRVLAIGDLGSTPSNVFGPVATN